MRALQIALATVSAMALLGCQPRAKEDLEIVQAVRDNDAAAVSAYLAGGGDPDLHSRSGEPLLYLASGPRGGEAVLAKLIEGGATLDATNADGRTPLINAAGWCSTDVVDLLLAGGADRTLRDKEGATARDAVCAGPLDMRAQVLNSLDAGS